MLSPKTSEDSYPRKSVVDAGEVVRGPKYRHHTGGNLPTAHVWTLSTRVPEDGVLVTAQFVPPL